MTEATSLAGSPVRTATPELVHQLVAEIRASDATRDVRPLVIGARARPQWSDGSLEVDGAPVTVAPCPTPLAARVALDRLDDDEATLVVLTDLREEDLGADLMARFVKPRLFSLNSWNAVLGRFGARRLDPAFGAAELAWLADALLALPTDRIARGASVLTVESALAAVAQHTLGATGISLDRLLVASAEADITARIDRTDPRTLEGLTAVLATRLGPAGELVAGMFRTGHGADALPAGLAAATVGTVGAEHRAIVRIEGLTGVDQPSREAIAAWAAAAGRAFDELDATGHPEVPRLLTAGSALATDWLAPDPAASEVLGIGFDARLDQLAVELTSALDGMGGHGMGGPAPFDGRALRDAAQRVQRHREARHPQGRHRAERALLAARLASWLRNPAASARGTGLAEGTGTPTLAEATSAYLDDGVWVDAARRRVGEGDTGPAAYAEVLQRLSKTAHDTRAEGNRRYAETMAGWSRHGTAEQLDDQRVVAVESILADVVAPLAKQHPVLLVVLDGCGLPQFAELLPQFRALGLAEIGRGGRRRAGLAALPTITAVSRTSLLCGRLHVGTQADEKRELPAHPAIARLEGPPAVVLHRSELLGGVGTGLPEPVTRALGTEGPRVVAAVVNTIDDELSRGTYTREYRIEDLDVLSGLVRTAAAAGRLVIVTADHGHVLGVGLDGAGAVAKGGEGGDRWRVADRPPTDDEVHLVGPRVLEGGEHGVLAPWHDDLRYSARHGGYHGGATPDETLVPLSVFAPYGIDAPPGWDQVDDIRPDWWDLATPAVEESIEVAPPSTPSRPKRPRKAPHENQGALFGASDEDAAASATSSTKEDASGTPPGAPGAPEAASTVPVAPWMAALERSPVYEIQLGAIARGRPDPERIRAALAALNARGGVASFAAVGAGTGMPASRVGGFLATLARLLNVDGFGVLDVDPTAQEARLDEQLLIDQFLDGRWP